MASLKALKIRIGSVKSTQKITKAMKMVAAAKLRRAQTAAIEARPYAQKLEGTAQAVSKSSDVSGGRGRPAWLGAARAVTASSESRTARRTREPSKGDLPAGGYGRGAAPVPR